MTRRAASSATAPGASITRRRKQADAHGGHAEVDVARPLAPAALPVRVLQTRVDALTLRYRGELAAPLRTALQATLACARELQLPGHEIYVGPHRFALSSKSNDGWWFLENDDVHVIIHERSTRMLDGWILDVKLLAMTLAAIGPEMGAVFGSEIATEVLGFVTGERVGRVDLCVDAVGLELEAIDPKQWLVRGRAQVQKRGPSPADRMSEYLTSGTRTSFYIGKGGVMLRAYDKTVELLLDVKGARRDAERERWRNAGWDGAATVTRVEYQLRGDVLKQLDDGLLRDVGAFHTRLDAAWKYLTSKWSRLCVVGSATRRTNWRTDPRWRVIQDATFVVSDGEIAVRKRSRGTPRPQWVASIALGYAAKSGVLIDDWPQTDEISKWPEGDAAAFVTKTLAEILGATGEAVARELVARLGRRRAAAYVVERLRAALAASSTAFRAEAEQMNLADLFADAAE